MTEAENAVADRIETHRRSNVVTICAWCPELHILKFDRQPSDLVLIQQTGLGVRDVRITRNGELMTISHGMCSSCESRERVRSLGNNRLGVQS